ncbi:MAG: hypothetical protein ACREP9_01845, partial [Candidatus Dormibacteraceae bacterium]
LAVVIVLRYLLPAVVGGALVLADRPVSLVHTPLGQLATLIIALGLGGLALFRELGWPSGELVMAMTVVMPAVTGAAWLNLFWVNRKAFDLGG